MKGMVGESPNDRNDRGLMSYSHIIKVYYNYNILIL